MKKVGRNRGDCLALLCALGTRPALAIHNGVGESSAAYLGVGEITPTAGHVLCTATLISKNAILTTASCLTDTTPGAVFTFAPSSTQSASIVKIVVHPEYNKTALPNQAFDIAIAVLSKAQNRTWNFSFPALATTEPGVATSGTAVGFGEGETATGVGSGARNSGTLAVSAYVSGPAFADGLMQLDPGTAAFQMICPGDTGGPFFIGGILTGLASFANTTNCNSATTAYEVPIARLNAWIVATRNQVDPAGACQVDDDAAFATEDGGCEDIAAERVWSALSPNALDRAGALAYCKNLNEAGMTGWWLPALHNLSGLDSDDTGHHIAEPSNAWAADSAGEDHGFAYSFKYHRFFYVESDSYHKVRCAH